MDYKYKIVNKLYFGLIPANFYIIINNIWEL